MRAIDKESQKLNHYDVTEVIDKLDIDQVFQSPLMDNWLSVQPVFTEAERIILEKKRQTLIKRVGRWNEQELIVRFVSQILDLADFDISDAIQPFFERPMEGNIGNYKISVVTDFMVASSKKSGIPEHPYFFLQEFKRSKGDQHDPEGQMLAAMFLAQELNKDGKPIYGAWLQGQFWRFAIVTGREYCASRAFDATQEHDLNLVVGVLRKLKALILNQ